jgi:predicted nucleic acid-binding protein
MKYVLDSSVALKWVLPEADSGTALRLLDETNNAIHELIAPDLFSPEVANGLATAERQGRIKPGEAATLLLDIVRQAPAIHVSSSYLIRALEVAVSTRQAVYDCIYLALAEAEQCEMVSADDAFVRKMKTAFPFLIRLADLP